ncbi:hypothetical protein G6F22_006652 [Rhizopus arrhizus]|nr:hypothetical protein G6F22_006652 [Rhizopus arrhizus]
MPVVVEHIALEIEGREDVIVDLSSPEAVEQAKNIPFTIKEGAEYRMKVKFRVQHDVVSGLKYLQVVKRKGIRVDKTEEMIGSYGPSADPYEKKFLPEEAPSGMLARGHYEAKSKFIDDDNVTHMEWTWSFDIKKDCGRNANGREALTNIRRYCIDQELQQTSMATDLNARIIEQKLLLVYYKRVKLFNTAKSGRLTGEIAERTSQKWAKRLKKDKDWGVLQKQTNKVNRKKSELDEEHKVHINFYDDHPQARVNESEFNINMRPPGGRSEKGTSAVVATPSTRGISHTVLRAITAKFIVSMELRKLQVAKNIRINYDNRKRKAPSSPTKRTATGHYLHFIQKTLDEMDQFEELKGFYLVMDNAPIHIADKIKEVSVVKNKIKHSSFATADDLATRISEACNAALQPSSPHLVSKLRRDIHNRIIKSNQIIWPRTLNQNQSFDEINDMVFINAFSSLSNGSIQV